jgi:signal transduction histidine kinase
MVIIGTSMILLLTIIGTLVDDYSEKSKNEAVSSAAGALGEGLQTKLERYGTSGSFSSFCDYYENDINSQINAVKAMANFPVTVFIADSEGVILIASPDENCNYQNGSQIPRSLMNEINNGIELSVFNNLEGIFDTPHVISATPVYLRNNYVCGTVIVCCDVGSISDFAEVLIKTVAISSLWVMLAALIAIFFISERIISPLRGMSQAAKAFAKGEFSVRVPVVGNDEVAQLASAFNNMAQNLENLDEMRNNFMSSVSHDMRTPMTTISGFIDCILSGAIPPEKHEYYLKIIRDEVLRLSRLVASLLDISRIQAGDRKFVMEPFDICEMGRQVLISFEQKIDKKRLEVEFICDDDNMFVTGDHDAIYQIFYNITDNAVKFANENGLLRISLTKVEKSKVRVAVYNEGDGIPYDDQPYIFERFYKSDRSRGKDKSGVGLGMFIAKTIIEAHKEVIALESEPGKYCEFYFTLPITPEDKRPQKSRE